MIIRRSGMSHKIRPFLYMATAMTLVFLAGNFSACEPEDWILEVSCDDCYGFKPDSADLIIYVSIRPEQDSVPLTFYRDDSQGEVDWQDTATTSEFYLYSAMGSTYTVKAEYKSGSKTIIAWDADEMTLEDYGTECGDPCYIIKGGILDLRLKSD